MRISPITMLALLLSACGSKTEQIPPRPQTAAPAAAQPVLDGDAVAAVLESQGRPPVQLRFVLDGRPVAGKPFHLQLVASSSEPVPPMRLTTESSALKIDPATRVLALSAAGSGTVPAYGATYDFYVSAAQEGLAELTVRLVADADTTETLYVIPVMVGKADPAEPAGAPASDKPDPAAAGDHAEPQKG